VPDLVPGVSAKDVKPTGFSFRTTLAVDDDGTSPRSASAPSDYSDSGNRSLSAAAGAPASNTLIDSDGVKTLEELSFQLTGRQGAQAIRQLSEIAVRAERVLPWLGYPHHPDYLADVSILAGTAGVVRPAAKGRAGVEEIDQPWW